MILEQAGEELCIVIREKSRNNSFQWIKLWMQDQLHNLQGSVKNEIVGPLVQELLRISKQ